MSEPHSQPKTFSDLSPAIQAVSLRAAAQAAIDWDGSVRCREYSHCGPEPVYWSGRVSKRKVSVSEYG